MSMTGAQLITFGNDIRANTDQTVIDALANGEPVVIANWYNQNASPDFHVFRQSVSEREVRGVLVWSEYVALSRSDQAAFELLIKDGYDANEVNVRDGLAEIFKGGTQSGNRGALINLSTKLASNVEKLFAVDASGTTAGGDGSANDAAAELVYVGPVQWPTVKDALDATA